MLKKTLLLVCLFFLSFSLIARELKIGVLAPDGTNWANNLRAMANEIKTATDGAVTLRIYFGGAQGDEPDVLRRIRMGQLQGGIFTGKTLGDIYGDIRVLELPFTFDNNKDLAWSALESMEDYFTKGLREKGFVSLGFFELGMVYFVSTKKNENLDSLSGLKIWQWEGDPLVAAMTESMGLVSVPLPLPDVLSSLSTGIVEAAYAPALGIVSLQWNTRVNYLVDFPIAYSLGAMLVDQRSWGRISQENRDKILEISHKYVRQINQANRQDNQDALMAMQASGVEFLSFPESDIQTGRELREKIVKRLKGRLFSKDVFSQMESHIKKNKQE